MSDLIIPAPLWRRFASAIYDGLLLIGLWAATLLACLPLQFSLHLPPGTPWFSIPVFFVWLGFYCWFWTHGGQTLGMRAWRLQVRRIDGAAVRLPIAAVRYLATLVYWGLALAPVGVAGMARSPGLSALFPHAASVAAGAATLVLISLALRWLDRASRLPQDWVSGTEVVQLPQNPSPPTR